MDRRAAGVVAGHRGRKKEGASWIDGQVSPSFLFFWGLLLAPPVVLQHSLWLKALQAALFALLALAAGRIHSAGVLLGSLVFVLVTVAVNLLSPLGRLLVALGPLRVTEGALSSGLARALTVLALSYLSRLCVRDDLSLPGSCGRYLRLTFGYLKALLVRRPAVVGRDLIGRIDAVLEAVLREEPGPSRLVARRTTGAGWGLTTVVGGLIWLSVFWRI